MVFFALGAMSCNTREIGDRNPNEQWKLVEVFSDDFERKTLGSAWKRGHGEGGKGTWRIDKGAVRGENIKNDPLWLTRPLPDKVRVEFDAKSLSKEGDLKFEIFGDGTQHSSGYIVIFGGWSNSLDVIARLDEHGKDRLSKRSIQVKPQTVHRLALERTDPNVLRFYIDGDLVLTYKDKRPLLGQKHQFFAFNDWTAPVQFDNLKIYELKRP